MELDLKLRKAAIDLGSKLRGYPWFSSIGIAEEAGQRMFIIYLSKRLPRSARGILPSQWEGFPIQIKELGKIIPARIRKTESRMPRH